jgi:hypothetical protein
MDASALVADPLFLLCVAIMLLFCCAVLCCVLQVLPDDVAVELPGDLLLCSAAEQLHAVLHLPHAHHLHSVCVRMLGHSTTPQQDTSLDVDQVRLPSRLTDGLC